MTPVYRKNWREITLFLEDVVPPRIDVFENASVIFYCGSLSAVSWSLKPILTDNLMPSSRRYPVSTRHLKGIKTITLVNLLSNDSGMYYCKGTGKNKTFVRMFYVKVWGNVRYGKVIPNWVEVTEGNSVTLTCGSVKPVLWTSVHFDVQNKSFQGNSLTLYNLEKDHSGRYMCRGVVQHKLKKYDWSSTNNIFHSWAIIIVDGFVVRISHK